MACLCANFKGEYEYQPYDNEGVGRSFSSNCCTQFMNFFRSSSLCKPLRVLFATFYKWSIPKLCLLMLVILFFVVAFGFRIKINQSVFDLNENIAARELTWFFLSVFTSFIIAFYVIEWVGTGLPSTHSYGQLSSPPPTVPTDPLKRRDKEEEKEKEESSVTRSRPRVTDPPLKEVVTIMDSSLGKTPESESMTEDIFASPPPLFPTTTMHKHIEDPHFIF